MILSYRQQKQMAALLESAGKGILCHLNTSQKYVNVTGHFQRDKAYRKFLDRIWHIDTPLIFSVGYSLICFRCME